MELLFLQILEMSFTASIAFFGVLLARLALKRAPKIFAYLLWFLVFFRLVCPLSFESGASLYSLIPFQESALSTAEQQIERTGNEEIAGDLDRSGNEVLPGDMITEETTTVSVSERTSVKTAEGSEVLEKNTNTNVTPTLLPASLSDSAPDSASSVQYSKWLTWGTSLWLAGVFVLLLRSGFAALRLRRRMQTAKLLNSRVYEWDGLRTPFVFGLIRPKICLPFGLTGTEREYVLMHEQVHIQRWDHVVKLLAYAILCLHWFNPLVWAAFLLMSTDMELSCDESVVKRMGSEIKRDYSLSLLSISAGKSFSDGTTLSFGENNIKARVANVLNYKKPGFRAVALSLLVLLLAGILLLSNPPKNAADERGLAEAFVEENIHALEKGPAPAPRITASQITKLEHLQTFDNLLPSPLALWELEYRLKPDSPEQALLSGNLNLEDGWITEEGSMGKPVLIFSYEERSPKMMGVLYSSGETGDLSTESGRETALRKFLESSGRLPHLSYKEGDHALVLFPLSTGETAQLLLSQPADAGPTGIWAVERWKDSNGNEYLVTPQAEGSITDYYKNLQAEADSGRSLQLLDRAKVSLSFIKGELGQPITSADQLEIRHYSDEAYAASPESRLTGYIRTSDLNNRRIGFDQVERLTDQDGERLKRLGIEPDRDMPNGFYILNKYDVIDPYEVNADAVYEIQDPEAPATLKPVTAAEFAEHLSRQSGTEALYVITTQDGRVTRITEQYLP
ncbi:M56 family metallopeptidase [Paenibacillus sp. CN-4]|uniref:M56 family metallopeptidase n=1 Tax=Paenibacillus nanchangensis TaxID=3348343 RepID=UPI00397B7945